MIEVRVWVGREPLRHTGPIPRDRLFLRPSAAFKGLERSELAETLCQPQLRSASLAASRSDDYHAVRGLRSVDRRSRGTLQDLDAGDVGRVDVGDAVYGVILCCRESGVGDYASAAGD